MTRIYIVIACLLPVAAAQTTRLVPSQFATIQGAIVASANGDTVVVDPGVYFERLNFLGKAVTVRSTDGPETTVVDGQSLGATVSFVTGETALSVLEGFKLINGKTGVVVNNASPVVRRCTIATNTGPNGTNYIPFQSGGSPGSPGGVAVSGGQAAFEDCVIEWNVGGRGGDITGSPGAVSMAGGPGGVGVYQGSPVFRRCVIRKNSGGDGGILLYAGYSASLLGTTGGGGAGGIRVLSVFSPPTPTTLTLENCAVVSNTGGDAPGGYIVGYRGVGGIQTASPTSEFPYTSGLCAMLHATVAGNATGLSGSGSFAAVYGPINAQNSVISGSFGVGQLVATYCAVATAGLGNITLPPQLVYDGAGRPRLAPTSPCRDAGTNTAPGIPPTDLFGNDRSVGLGPDIGCSEFPETEMYGTSEDLFLDVSVNGGAPVGFEGQITSGDIVTCRVHSPNGTFALRVVTLGAQVFLPYDPPGSINGFPELRFDIAEAFVIWDGFTVDPITPVGLPASGPLDLNFTLNAIAVGLVGRVQAIAFNPAAANNIFAATDAVDLAVY